MSGNIPASNSFKWSKKKHKYFIISLFVKTLNVQLSAGLHTTSFIRLDHDKQSSITVQVTLHTTGRMTVRTKDKKGRVSFRHGTPHCVISLRVDVTSENICKWLPACFLQNVYTLSKNEKGNQNSFRSDSYSIRSHVKYFSNKKKTPLIISHPFLLTQ